MTVSHQIEKSLEITVSHTQIEKSLDMTVSHKIEKQLLHQIENCLKSLCTTKLRIV